ncbi:hypothetical protein DIPPA_30814 [Diplonema papillatum]|nr:hypothetical protein DIPPA_30814 [Diplonema papillatum]
MSPVLQTAGRGHAQWLEVPYYSPRGHTAPSPPSPQHLPGRGRSAFSRLSDYSHSSLASLRPHVSSADPVCTPARAGRGLRSPPVVMERRFSTLSISNSMNRLGSVVSSGRGTPLSTVGVRPSSAGTRRGSRRRHTRMSSLHRR